MKLIFSYLPWNEAHSFFRIFKHNWSWFTLVLTTKRCCYCIHQSIFIYIVRFFSFLHFAAAAVFPRPGWYVSLLLSHTSLSSFFKTFALPLDSSVFVVGQMLSHSWLNWENHMELKNSAIGPVSTISDEGLVNPAVNMISWTRWTRLWAQAASPSLETD